MESNEETPQSDHVRGVTISFGLMRIVAIIVIVLLAGSAVWYSVMDSTSRSTTRVPSRAAVKTIHLTYPSDWRAVSAKSVRGVPSNAVLVLQRRDKSGVLIVLSGGRAPAFNATFANAIGTTLSKKYADYKFLSTKVLQLKQEKAFLFSYLRTRQDMLHTITIVPAGRRSFLIETASSPTNRKLGIEIGTILESTVISPSA